MPNKDNKTEEEKECKNCKGHPDGDYGQCGTCNRMITQFPAEEEVWERFGHIQIFKEWKSRGEKYGGIISFISQKKSEWEEEVRKATEQKVRGEIEERIEKLYKKDKPQKVVYISGEKWVKMKDIIKTITDK